MIKKVKTWWEKKCLSDIWHNIYFFIVILSCEREPGGGKTSFLQKLPSTLLHHCRSVSPSSSPGCPPLDTLNWIPVRCAALPWVSFLRVTEHWAVCVHLCVCGEKANQLSVWKKYTHEQTQNDRCQQTYAYTHTYTHSSRPSLLQAVVCRKHTPISMGLGTAG